MYAPESKVLEVTDVCIGAVAKGERVTPKEPLAIEFSQRAASERAREFDIPGRTRLRSPQRKGK